MDIYILWCRAAKEISPRVIVKSALWFLFDINNFPQPHMVRKLLVSGGLWIPE